MTLVVIEHAHRTDTGRQRNANEDSYFARAPVFAVADGMGGAQAGEVASRIAAGAFQRGADSQAPPESRLEQIALNANREIHELAQRDSSRAGMGTTLTAAMVQGNEVSLGHVGDSRAYVLRDGQLKRLTKDHSLVEELRRQGRLTEEEAEEHPQRSIITRALGPEPEVNVDTMTFPAKAGDVFLLSSDGLTTMVSDEQIAAILAEAKTLRGAVNRLVDAANANGGRDNITAVAFRVAEAGAEPEEGATLISRTAEQAGMTSERMRRAGDRLRGQGPMPLPHRKRIWLRVALIAAAVAIVLGGVVLLVRQVYFLGTDEDGRVALYRGLPYELPFGANLYSEQYSIGVQAAGLSPERQEVVTEHKLRSEDDATDIVNDIEQREGSAPPVTPAPKPKAGDKKKERQRAKAPAKRKQPQGPQGN
ncbi:MAG TPA: Stp1/IreP family PP2C-type Ser/Thr phosphatase [Solirubrobacterales bacterium]|nr:Stp1/IreP family PP2C-type Ser/Thr phosphatase [Solirubrobacterales bacterium]